MTDSSVPDSKEVWPGVLDEIDIQYVPVEYITSVEVTFTDGNIWTIDIDSNLNDTDDSDDIDELDAVTALEESLDDLFEEYEDVIKGINFVLDVEKVKKDVTSKTKLFMQRKSK